MAAVLCLAAIGAVAFSVYGRGVRDRVDDDRRAVVSWSPAAITETLSAGTSSNVTVNLTASHDLKNVCLRMTRELAGIFQVSPTNFSVLTKNQTVTVTVSLSVPATFAPSTLNGAIQVRMRSGDGRDGKDCIDDRDHGVIARPLPVRVNVVWATFTDTNTGVQISYPDFGLPSQVRTFFPNTNAERLEVQFQTASDTNFVTGFSLVLITNQTHATLPDWFRQNVDPDGTLVTNGTFVVQQLASGTPVFVLSGPVPADYEGGPLADIYSISTSADTIVIGARSQTGRLDELGLTSDEEVGLLKQVLSTLQLP